MSKMDDSLLTIKTVEISKTDAAEKLALLLSDYPWDSIKRELSHLSDKTSSSHDVLKFISAPARLEFLTALAIKSQLPDIEVVPNYPCDDEGLPTSTAGGNMGDIECFEAAKSILVEVTMAEGRQQTMMEVWPISRHLEEFKGRYEFEDSQCVFVAPSIFADTTDQIDWVKDRKQLVIRPYRIEDFVDYLDSAISLYCAD